MLSNCYFSALSCWKLCRTRGNETRWCSHYVLGKGTSLSVKMFSSQPTNLLSSDSWNQQHWRWRTSCASWWCCLCRQVWNVKIEPHILWLRPSPLINFFSYIRIIVISIEGAIYTESSIKKWRGSPLVALYIIITSLFCHDYAFRDLKCDVILDMATLTGAQVEQQWTFLWESWNFIWTIDILKLLIIFTNSPENHESLPDVKWTQMAK